MMRSWDDVMDYLGSLPGYQQYAIHLRLQDAVKTEAQLAQFGVHTHPDPWSAFTLRKSKS
jgi:hypothetical protein